MLNKNGFLSLRNLFKYFTLIELFNILKHKCPISINELITPSSQNNEISLILPNVTTLLTLVYRALCSVLANFGTSIQNLCLINVLQTRVGLWYLAQQ